MLYLVEDRDYLKIGYSISIDQRQLAYKTTNCYAKFIDGKPGLKEDETKLHILCNKGKYEREWFYNVPEVKEIGNKYQSESITKLYELEPQMIEVLEEFCKNNSIPDFRDIPLYASFPFDEKYNKIMIDVKNDSRYDYISKMYNNVIAFRNLLGCAHSRYDHNWQYTFYDRFEVTYTVTMSEDKQIIRETTLKIVDKS